MSGGESLLATRLYSEVRGNHDGIGFRCPFPLIFSANRK